MFICKCICNGGVDDDDDVDNRVLGLGSGVVTRSNRPGTLACLYFLLTQVALPWMRV